MSVFEFTIRFVGGLLSIYALTGDEVSLVDERKRRKRRRRRRRKRRRRRRRRRRCMSGTLIFLRYSSREL